MFGKHKRKRKKARSSRGRRSTRRTMHRKRRSAKQVKLRKAQRQCASEHLPRGEYRACVRTEIGLMRAMSGRRRRR